MAEIKVLFHFVLIPLLIAAVVIAVGTAFNFMLSKTLAKNLSWRYPKYRRTMFWGVFLSASLVIHLHVRIIGMLNDVYYALFESYEIYQPIEVSTGSPVSVELNQHHIRYKRRYLESSWLGEYSRSLSSPKITTDYFVDKLASQGLHVQHGTNINVPLQINGTVTTSDNHQAITMVISQNGKKVAEYSKRFRTSFSGEQSDSALVKLGLAILQSTPTRLLFPDFWDRSEHAEYPVSDFLSAVLHISPPTEVLRPMRFNISAFNSKVGERVIPDDKLNLRNELCQWEQLRVRIFRRYVDDNADLDELDGARRKQSGYWLEIRPEDGPVILQYLQAPHGGVYRQARIHQTVCTAGDINVLVSFAGVGKTEAEWASSLEQYSGPTTAKTRDEQAWMAKEIKRVNSINNSKIQSEFRKGWILKYSYDGKLKEAAVFTLPADFPQHVDILVQQEAGAWRFTGYDAERRRVDGKFRTISTKDYEVMLEKDE